MTEVMYNDYAKQVLEALPKGAFLNVSASGIHNTMTIGWGSLGVIWQKPVLMVMVRQSRYTYELIEQTDCFTVSLPFDQKFKEALAICGKTTGKGCDKWQLAGLTKLPAHKVDGYLVDGCDLHYECRIIGKQKLTSEVLPAQMTSTFYGNNDYHTLYYGEIVGTYLK